MIVVQYSACPTRHMCKIVFVLFNKGLRMLLGQLKYKFLVIINDVNYNKLIVFFRQHVTDLR